MRKKREEGERMKRETRKMKQATALQRLANANASHDCYEILCAHSRHMFLRSQHWSWGTSRRKVSVTKASSRCRNPYENWGKMRVLINDLSIRINKNIYRVLCSDMHKTHTIPPRNNCNYLIHINDE